VQRAIALLTVCLTGSLALGQHSATVSSDPNNPARPVATLLVQFRKLEKIAITYEDPRYASRTQMRGKQITFTYSSEELHTPQGQETVIARLLHEYDATGGITYTVVRDGLRLHVIPNETLNQAGERVRQESILDTVITVPAARRDGSGLLQAICDELQKQTGYEIAIGPSAPSNNLSQYVTSEGIDHLSARTALQGVLDRATPPVSFTWDLYYDPADGGYGLNFAYVGLAGPASSPR
jgi:hypothetical protein